MAAVFVEDDSVKTYKEGTKLITEKKLDKIICDLCGIESDHLLDWYYDIEPSHTQIYMNYDELSIDWDICPECFRTKLIPWFNKEKFNDK